MAGKATDAGADLVGHRERVAVARGQRLGLARGAAVPDRAHGVDDEARRQVEAVGDHGLAGRALADGAAGRLQPLGAGGAVDGAVDAPPPRSPRFAALTTASTCSAVMSPCAASSRGGTRARPRPPVVEVAPERRAAGTKLEQRDARAPAPSRLVFSPQFENVTVPWMADEPLAPGLVTSSIGSGVPLAGM